jgi:hypothetical protein
LLTINIDCCFLLMQDSDIELARGLVEQDKTDQKIVELPLLVETETLEGRFEGCFRTINTKVNCQSKLCSFHLSSIWELR